MTAKALASLLLAIILAIILIALAGLLVKVEPGQVRLGVTFSPKYAVYLGLPWQKTYLSLLDDLRVRRLRIPTYWNFLEPQPGKFDFSQTDFMLDEAGKRGAKVILVLGERQPRWPECYIPLWAKSLTKAERSEKLLAAVAETVKRYSGHPAVSGWQVENEPSLPFGENCDIPSREFLVKEISVVRGLSDKTVLMTDSGELGSWVSPMQMSDVFGTTLYRKVYDNNFGHITYPALPSFYKIKSNLIRGLFAPKNQETIIVELQAEPWLANGVFLKPAQQARLFSTEDFKNYVNFASKTGFGEIYLWGVEWWYFMAAQGYPEYLDYARMLFR